MKSRSLWLVLALFPACSPAPRPTVDPPHPTSTSTAVASIASTPPPVSPTSTPDARFSSFSARFLAELLRRSPVLATGAGNHDHDARWPDVSEEGDAEQRKFLAATRAELAALTEGLGEQNAIDAAILKNQLDLAELTMDELRPAVESPLYYTTLIGDGLDPLLTRSFAPVDERVKSVRGRLEGIPAIVLVAKKRLVNPPRIFTQTAIAQNKSLIELCEKQLVADLAKTPAQKAELEAPAKAAGAALRELQAFFESDLLARSGGSFRVGRAKFEKVLRYTLEDDLAADDMAKAARELLVRTQDEMAETAVELWPSLMKTPLPAMTTADQKKAAVKRVLDKLAEERFDNRTILPESKALLVDATKFVASHDLVRVPEEPCEVIEMPEYRRGVTVAYCDSSGPLEKKQETFYAISPTPKDWPAARALSFYREYNKSMLADLTVHEAMPGHFLQAMHANRFHSDVRAVFANGAFVEGWAVYAEWLMTKHGFGGPKVRMQRQKMLARVTANAILDFEIHANGMEEKDALALMMREAFQEEGEAVGKWKRARLSSGQLTTYFYGFREMARLREAVVAKGGFEERRYHDKLLSFGAPAMRYVRALMQR